MAIRWRLDGSLICAAVSDPQDNDTYIDDRLHHQLHSVSGSLLADVNHEENGLWHWIHLEGVDGSISTGLRAEVEIQQ